jgi:two-component system, chemotaxis family, CheB/CheR fusion protein
VPAKEARILIVDDDVDATELLTTLLEARGHQVAVANSVDEALRIAPTFLPDVALLDIMIRCESGFFLAQELRDAAHLTACRFIAMTGFDREQHRRSSEAAGFQCHLVKPLDLPKLYSAIESER